MKRNAALLLFMLLGLAVAFVGCDTNESENEPIDENLVGTWNTEVVSVVVAGNPLPVYEASDEGTLAITFSAEDEFTFVAEGPISIESSIPAIPSTVILADGEGATISGDYAFTAGAGAVTFTPTVVETGGNEEPITGVPATPIPIEFESENEVTLTIENTDEGRAVLEFLLSGQVDPEVLSGLLDAIDSVQITFRRN